MAVLGFVALCSAICIVLLITVVVLCLSRRRLRVSSIGLTAEVLSALPSKIAVLGLTGSGKSNLAAQLSNLLQVEHFNLDTMLWENGAWMPDNGAWQKLKAAVSRCAASGWVCDGNYHIGMKQCWGRADILIILDPPSLLRIFRIIRRGAREFLEGTCPQAGLTSRTSWFSTRLRIAMSTVMLVFQWWQVPLLEERLSEFRMNCRQSYEDAVEKRRKQQESGQKSKELKRPLRETVPVLVLRSDDDVRRWLDNVRALASQPQE